MKYLLIMILNFTISDFCFPQINQEWTAKLRVVNGNETLVRDMTTDAMGNVYVTGSCPVPQQGRDFVTVKYNSAGSEQWVSYYNGTDELNDGANCIAVDNSGNVFVGGSGYTENNLSDFILVKYNSSGLQQWVQSYDGPGHLDDGIDDLAIDQNSGNVCVTGGSWGLPGAFGTNLDYATICYSNNGARMWVKRYNGIMYSWDASCGLEIDSKGNIIVTGYSSEIGNQSEDITTIKYNSSGDILWVSHFDSPSHYIDNATSLTLDKNDNIYVTGFSNTVTNNDFTVVKYNSSGIQIWSALYDGTASGWDYPNSIATDTSGNVYVSGVSTGIGSMEDYLTLKYDSTGNFQWSARYNNNYNRGDRLEGMVADKSGNVYVTGYSFCDSLTFSYLTIKYNTSGQQQWLSEFQEAGIISEYGRAIILDNNNNVYVSGYTYGNSPVDNIVTVKYSQTTSVNSTPLSSVSGFVLEQNFPNPFNPVTRISYSLGKTVFISIIIFDVTGKEIISLVNQTQQAGNYSVRFDGSVLPSGLYFYKLNAGNFTDVKKMMIIK